MYIYFPFPEYDLLIAVKKETYLNFKPTYLYIKTHNKTGLKYFGKTVKDPLIYRGSGTRWTNHINKHGYDVLTEIYGLYNTYEECLTSAVNFSFKNNIVKNKVWANLVIEILQGNSMPGKTNPFFGKTHTKKSIHLISIGNIKAWDNQDKRKAKSLSMIGVANPMFGINEYTYGITEVAKRNKGKNFDEIYGLEKSLDLKLKFEISRNNSRKICPHCCLEKSAGCSYVYHFDNCKLNPDNPTNIIGSYSNYPRVTKRSAEYKCIHCCNATPLSTLLRWHNDNCKLNPDNPTNIIGAHSIIECACGYKLKTKSGNARRFFNLNHGKNCKIFTDILN